MITVPQSFLEEPTIPKWLQHGLNCVVYKSAQEVNPNNERYVSAHALTMIQSGSLVVSKHPGEKQIVTSGEMVFLPRGLYFISDIIPDDQPFEAIVCFFEEGLIRSFLEQTQTMKVRSISRSSPQPKVFVQPEECSLFLSNLSDLYSNASLQGSEVAILKLKELLHLLASSEILGDSFIAALSEGLHRQKVNVRTFMERNFDKPLNVDDYAYLTGRSPSSFYRDFKRIYKTSPQKWIIQKRLSKAKELLKEDFSTTVTQTAFDAGYEDLSHFIKAFKKEYGISPKQFQMELRKSISI